MRRQNMKLGDLLRQSTDIALYELIPGGEDYVAEIARITGVELDTTKATGGELLRALSKLSVSQRTTYLNKEVEVGGNTLDAAMLSELISQMRSGQSGWKTAVAVGMAVLIALVVCNHSFLMYLATVHNYPMVRWQDSVYILIIPGGIVWTWYGVLSKENRDIIAAYLGEIPKSGPLGAVVDIVTRKRTQQPVGASNVQPDPVAPQQRQQSADGATGAKTDIPAPNDNPPPGAAFDPTTEDGKKA